MTSACVTSEVIFWPFSFSHTSKKLMLINFAGKKVSHFFSLMSKTKGRTFAALPYSPLSKLLKSVKQLQGAILLAMTWDCVFLRPTEKRNQYPKASWKRKVRSVLWCGEKAPSASKFACDRGQIVVWFAFTQRAYGFHLGRTSPHKCRCRFLLSLFPKVERTLITLPWGEDGPEDGPIVTQYPCVFATCGSCSKETAQKWGKKKCLKVGISEAAEWR